MNYIYDIILNFQDEYYDFYEWKKTDKVINVKKLPIYKISTNDYLNIKNNEVTIDKKSLPTKNKIFLITNDFEIMGITIDNLGKVKKKSSLIFEESDDILESKDQLKKINIEYNIIKKNKTKYISRIEKEKYYYLKKYFKKINLSRDEYLLKYLYYDLYNIDESDTKIIYNKLLSLSKNKINELYSCVKRVNLELNK